MALATNLRLAQAPGNVLLPHRLTGLPKDCVANVSQVMTMDKRVLTEVVGQLPAALLHRTGEGLQLAMDL